MKFNMNSSRETPELRTILKTPVPAADGAIGWGLNIRFGVYLVGAPRCGTSAFSKVLKRNPQICFSDPKENHYFLLAPPGIPVARFKRRYLRAFYPSLNGAHRVIIDGSVTYLYSPDSLRRILEVDPAARFIVMIRNPVDLVYSYHARLLFTMDEDVEDFERAWRLQEKRSLGTNIPRRCRDPHRLQYKSAVSLGAQLEKLFDIAGRERCQVIVFDDFISDPVGVYRKLLEFIDVDDDGQTDFRRKNSNRMYKNRFLQRIVMSPPAFVFRIVVKRRLNGKSIFDFLRRYRKRLKARNLVIVERPPMREELRRELREEFAPDVRRLSGLLGRTFENWV